tara:strand:- start:1450 stop:1695 length:246 start_codon:yes stop_codon:yes gene_type:complete
MKATIISNGSTRIVLKPESPADLLAIKDLADKKLITLHYETTQILAESYPNCLVISEDKSVTPLEPTKNNSLLEKDLNNVR